MESAPPVSAGAPRRHRSRQRDALLAWLRSTTSHPTAAEIRTALEARSANVSLATVYRNLEVLLAEGEVREVVCEGGPARYDANLEPHHHFSCERCGRIVDVAVPTPARLARRVAHETGLEATRVSITFHGSCEQCTAVAESSTPSRQA